MISINRSSVSRGQGAAGIAGYDVVRVVAALVLLGAGTLKGFAWWVGTATAGDHLLDSRWVSAGAVGFELGMGLWLLVGLCPGWSRMLALACFLGLAAIATLKVAVGERSCGCFGTVSVSPWYALCFDAVVVAALLRWRPDAGHPALRGDGPSRVVLSAVASSLLGLSGVGVVLAGVGPAGAGRLMEFGSESRVGEPFRLIEKIDIGERLAAGRWVVLIYHRNCPRCRAVIPLYEQLARDLDGQPGTPGVAMVEAPPFEDHAFTTDSRANLAHGRIATNSDIMISTPVAFKLVDGNLLEVLADAGNVDPVFPE
jgi:hypothetical protein